MITEHVTISTGSWTTVLDAYTGYALITLGREVELVECRFGAANAVTEGHTLDRAAGEGFERDFTAVTLQVRALRVRGVAPYLVVTKE